MTVDTTSPSVTDTLFTRSFVMLGVADLAYFTATGVAIYALPLYVTGPIGSDKTGAGIAFGAFAVAALLLRPIAGRLCDRWGRRPFLAGGALLAAASLALTSETTSLTAVIGLRLLLGVAEAAFFVASFAALADLAPPTRLGEALSYNSLGLYLGLAFGPPLGELMVELGSYRSAWFGAAALAAVASVLVLTIGETRAPDDGEGSHALIHRRSLPVALAFLTSMVAIGGFLSLAALHAKEVGVSNASVPFFVYGIVVVTCRIAFARVPDRLPSLALGAAALAATAAGLAIAATWGTTVGLLVGTVVLGIGVTFSTPAFFAAIFATAKPSERGAASGTASASIDLGLGGGPILLGLVAQYQGIPSAFLVAAGVAMAGSAWSLVLRRK